MQERGASSAVRRALSGRRGRRQSFCRLGVLVAVLVASAQPSPVAAQPAAAQEQPSKADRVKARSLMDRGYDLVSRKKYAQALEAFKEADAMMGVPTTGIAVAETYEKMGKLLEAREAAVAVSNHPRRRGEPAVFTTTRRDARRLTDRLMKRLPSLELELATPDGPLPATVSVVVSIDGNELAALDRPERVNPGSHRIEASAPGYHDVNLTVAVSEGKSRRVKLLFNPADTQEVSTGPDEIGGGQQVERAFDDEDDRGGISPLAPVGFTIAAIGAGVGIGMGVAALSKESDLAEQCPDKVCPATVEDNLDDAEVFARVSTISFAVGGAGLVLGIVGVALSFGGDDEPEVGQVRVEPLVGPGWLGLRGSF
jgi:hypothetical protein